MKFKILLSIFTLCSSCSIFPLAFVLEPVPQVNESKTIKSIVLRKKYNHQNCSLFHPLGEFLVCRESDTNPKANFYFQKAEDSLGGYWDRIQKLEMISRDEESGEIALKLYLASAPDRAITHKTKTFPQIFFVSFKINQTIIPEDRCKFELSKTSANLSCTTEDKLQRESKSSQMIFSKLYR